MGAFKDLTGQMINNWLIIEHKGFNKHGASIWLCECQCDKRTQRIKDISQIRARKSCGCLNIKNLKGSKFGRLTVVSDPLHIKGKIYFACDCECGNKDIKVRSDGLQSGASNSCGCLTIELRTKTGCSRERLYGIWSGMITRCMDSENKRYDNYGGRGIKVCQEWLDDYIKFKKWAMDNGYDDTLTIERVDVNGNYEPNNCEWIPMKLQARNKTTTIYLNLTEGVYKLIDIARDYNIPRVTILKRYENGINNIKDLTYDGNYHNKSGVIGVCFDSRNNKWRSYINVNHERMELGRYTDKYEAIVSRLKAELKYFGNKSIQSHLFKDYNIGDGIYDLQQLS